MSEITKQCKKKMNFYCLISVLMWLGTALFLTIWTLATATGNEVQVSEDIKFFTDEAQKWLLGIGTTAIIGFVGAIIIKDKIRTALWMASLILAVILFGKCGMFIVLGLWFIEEYIIRALYLKYKNKYTINKEIDNRN